MPNAAICKESRWLLSASAQLEFGEMAIDGVIRSQTLLLPDAVDDDVSADHLGRFINAFADELDLKKVGSERVQAKVIGHPGDDQADLLKLNIYGYLNRVHSNRQLEAETRFDIEEVSLLWRLAPDFETITDFRRDNRKALHQVFRAVVILCRQLKLFGRKLLTIKGTRVKDVNNKLFVHVG